MHLSRPIAVALVASLLLSFGAWADFSTRDPERLLDELFAEAPEINTPGKVPYFDLDGELGVIVSTGNTRASSLRAAVSGLHETEKWNNTYNAELYYRESADPANGRHEMDVTAQRFFGYGQFDYKLGQKDRRLFAYADYENDRFNGYDYRSALAVGWSQRLWRDDLSEFRYSIGPGYLLINATENNLTNINNGMILRASGEYRYRWSSGARFRQFVSTEAGTNNIRSRIESSLSASLVDDLSMKVAVVINHETKTPQSVSNLNTETSLSLVYQFF